MGVVDFFLLFSGSGEGDESSLSRFLPGKLVEEEKGQRFTTVFNSQHLTTLTQTIETNYNRITTELHSNYK